MPFFLAKPFVRNSLGARFNERSMWQRMFFKISSERHSGLFIIHSIKIKILANACRVVSAGLATPLMHCLLQSGEGLSCQACQVHSVPCPVLETLAGPGQSSGANVWPTAALAWWHPAPECLRVALERKGRPHLTPGGSLSPPGLELILKWVEGMMTRDPEAEKIKTALQFSSLPLLLYLWKETPQYNQVPCLQQAHSVASGALTSARVSWRHGSGAARKIVRLLA